MVARWLIRSLCGYGACLSIVGLLGFATQPCFAQMQRGLRLNLPDPTVVNQSGQAQAHPAAQSAAPAGLTAPTVQQIVGDLYEYSYLLPTGTGPYHSVGVHRVVRVKNGRPIASHNAIFLGHGDASNFGIYLAGTQSPQSLPVYLADNGIDVCGMDYGWALVPSTETDFTFMQNWGLPRDIDDLEAAILFARPVHTATGIGSTHRSLDSSLINIQCKEGL